MTDNSRNNLCGGGRMQLFQGQHIPFEKYDQYLCLKNKYGARGSSYLQLQRADFQSSFLCFVLILFQERKDCLIVL